MYDIEVTASTDKDVIDLVEAKSQVRVELDDTDNDAVLAVCIASAVNYAENYTRRDFYGKTYEMRGATWNDVYQLPRSPLISLDSIKYYDANNTLQTWAVTEYDYTRGISRPSFFCPKFQKYWPTVYDRPDAILVTFQSGYTDSNLPMQIKQALLLLVAHWFENREAVMAGVNPNELPMGAKALLDSVRI